MRKIILTFVLLSVAVTMAFAQKNRVKEYNYFPRSEFYIQYGTPSIIEFTTVLNSEYKSPSAGIDSESRNHKFSGIVALGYNFSITPKLSLGIDGNFGYGMADIYINDMAEKKLPSPVFVCQSSISSYSVHLSGAYTYWRQGVMECSGGLYLGVCFMDESLLNMNEADLIRYGLMPPQETDKVRFSYHITAVKFRYGDTVGGFAELGFGYRGLVNVGLSIKI